MAAEIELQRLLGRTMDPASMRPRRMAAEIAGSAHFSTPLPSRFNEAAANGRGNHAHPLVDVQ